MGRSTTTGAAGGGPDLTELAADLARSDAAGDQEAGAIAYWSARYGAALRFSSPERFRALDGPGRRERFARLARAGLTV